MIERHIPGQPPKRFPERDDLVATLIADDLVADEQDLLTRRPDLVGNLMLTWIQHSQTGCRFATHLAKKRADAGWRVVVMPRQAGELSIRETVDTTLNALSENDEMIMFVFPWVAEVDDLVKIVAELSQCHKWWWEEQFSVDGEVHDDILVGLRWLLPSGQSESWVLGFAPFDFLPFTRQAPYAAIVLRPIDPPEDFPRPDVGWPKVHLAQVPHFFGDRGRYKGEIWTSTEKLRADLLQGEKTYAAKARVTFALPTQYRPALPPSRSS